MSIYCNGQGSGIRDIGTTIYKTGTETITLKPKPDRDDI